MRVSLSLPNTAFTLIMCPCAIARIPQRLLADAVIALTKFFVAAGE
jgi:hypothetical protein